MNPRVWVLLFPIVLACSCTIYQHIPTPLNVPVLDKKDQLQVNIGGDFKKGYLQMDYAISNSIYLYGEGFYYKSKNSGWLDIITGKEGSEIDNYKAQISQFKTGLGFYRNDENMFINILAGVGLGNLDYDHGMDAGTYNINYHYSLQARNLELFLQPAIGLKMESYFDISFAVRMKQESYFHVWQNHTGDENHIGESYDYQFYRPFTSFQFIEPALTCRVGFKTVKLQLQGIRSFCLQGESLKSKKGSLNFQIDMSYYFGNKQSTSSL